MRAAMNSLATVHGTAYAFQHELGGKSAFLSKFPILTEDNMPRSKLLKVICEGRGPKCVNIKGKIADY